MELKNELAWKWNRLQEKMRETGADACMLTMSVNLYYMTGQVFSGYFYLPSEGAPVFFVRRPEDMVGENVYSVRKPEVIPELLESCGLKMPRKLLLEGDELPYSDYMRLQHIFQSAETGNVTGILRRQRMIKTPWEIGQIRESARNHEQVYREIPGCYRPGMTDLEFQIEIERRMRLHGSIGFFRAFGNNMEIFMGSLLAGENAGVPSAFDFALGGEGMHPSSPLGAKGIVLKEGTAVMVDMSGNYTAYQTDMTRVFSIGGLSDKAYQAHQVSIGMHAKLMKTAKAGTPCADVYRMMLEIARKEGLEDYFMGIRQQAKFVGHGIGLQINELPVLSPRSEDVLEPGMVFAFEPKFVLPGVGAVGVENTFLVTDNGLEKITLLNEDIVKLT